MEQYYCSVHLYYRRYIDTLSLFIRLVLQDNRLNLKIYLFFSSLICSSFVLHNSYMNDSNLNNHMFIYIKLFQHVCQMSLRVASHSATYCYSYDFSYNNWFILLYFSFHAIHNYSTPTALSYFNFFY